MKPATLTPDTQPPASTAQSAAQDAVPNPDMQREDAGTADSATQAAQVMKQTAKTGEEENAGGSRKDSPRGGQK